MDFVIFVIVIAYVSGRSIGIIQGILFGIISLIAMIIIPLVLTFLTGFILKPKRYLHPQSEETFATGDLESIKKEFSNANKIGDFSMVVAYLIILLISFNLGNGYFQGALMGIIFKTLIDLFWGDVPFLHKKQL